MKTSRVYVVRRLAEIAQMPPRPGWSLTKPSWWPKEPIRQRKVGAVVLVDHRAQ